METVEPVAPDAIAPPAEEPVVVPPEEPAPQPVPAAEAPPAPEPASPVEPVAGHEPTTLEPVPTPEPAPPAPMPYPPAALDQPEAPVEPVEPVDEPAPDGIVFRVTVRLSNGERVEAGEFADLAGAKQQAKSLVTTVAEADQDDWPYVSGRFLKPDTIVSVDIVEQSGDAPPAE
jgi:hypothetical protein